MRKELKKLKEFRGTFTGTFVREGEKSSFGHPKKTILLANITDSAGKVLTDHLWFNLTKGFASLSLETDDIVQFDARVKEYTKGYFGYRDDVFDKPPEIDYKLSHPTKLKKQARPIMPS